MILNKIKREVTSNLPGQKRFQISTTAKAFEILSSGLYNNKEAAVLRELACNAYDSHLDAKNIEPFEVFFPTELDPTLVVKDYGTGMAEENIYELYTTYFGSNKTESNVFTGALGLGSKSPFAIADQFTIENRYKGTKSTFVCFISQDGVPTISKLDETKTNDPNGMSIIVPVTEKRVSLLLKKEATKLLSVFKHTPKCHNLGSEIKSVFSKSLISGKGWTVLGNGSYNKTSFLQANVLYQVDNSKILEFVKEVYKEDSPQFYKAYIMKDSLYNSDTEFLIETSNGDLDFTASREELSLNSKTKKVIVDRFLSTIEDYRIEIQKQIDSKSTIQEVIELSNISQSFLLKFHINKVKQNKYYTYVDPSSIRLDHINDFLQMVFTFKNKNIVDYLMFDIPLEKVNLIYSYQIAKIHVKKVKYTYSVKRYINSNMKFFFLSEDDPNFNKCNAILRAHVLKNRYKAYVINDSSLIQHFPDTVTFENVNKMEDIREKRVGGSALYFTKEASLIYNKSVCDIDDKFTYSTLYDLQDKYEGRSIIYTVRCSSERKNILVKGQSISRNELYNNHIIDNLRRNPALVKYVENNFFPHIISVNKSESKSKKFLALENMIPLETILQNIADRFKVLLEEAMYNKSVYQRMSSLLNDNNFNYKILQYISNNKDISDFIKQYYPLVMDYVNINDSHNSTKYDLDHFSVFVNYGFLISPTNIKVYKRVEAIAAELNKIITDYPLLTMIETYSYNGHSEISIQDAILDYFINKI